MSTEGTGDRGHGAAAVPAREERLHHGARDHQRKAEGTTMLHTLYPMFSGRTFISPV